MSIQMGQPIKGMRPGRLLAPIFAGNSPRSERFSQAALTGGVIGLMLENIAWLTEFPQTPPLYQSGVIYRPEKHRIDRSGNTIEYGEDWQTIPYVIYNRNGDCEDLGAWRAAELRMAAYLIHFKKTGEKNPALKSRGIKALPDIAVRRLPDGAWRAHVRVRWPDGHIEDPSAKLGMYAYA